MIDTHISTEPLPYREEQLFDVAADIESYPAFLPGWVSARIIARQAGRLEVEQQLGLPLLNERFVSTAILQRPHHVLVRASDGPFKALEIHWRFATVAKQHSIASLTMSCQMRNALLERAARQLFDAITPVVMARFTDRARRLYGSGAQSG